MKQPTKISLLVATLACLTVAVLTVELRAEPRQPATARLVAPATPVHEDITTGTVARDTEGFTALPGYVGPAFVGGKSGRVVVLTNTVRSAPGTNWSAQALLRNETGGTVRAPRVTAHLFDAGHQEVGTAQTSVPLPSVRSGEPAPFAIRSDIPSTLVASVEWGVTYDTAPRAATYSTTTSPVEIDDSRTFEFSVFWQRAYGVSERLYGYPQNDSGDGPYPYVVFGEIHNIGTRPLAATRVLGAWLDSKGRVITVDWLSLRPATPDQKPQTSSNLGAGDYVDFLYTNSDPALAPQLGEAHLVLWGTYSE
ncbi:MAG TPA: hypothetical protein VN181_10805 [Thermoanaerobaculia bacterium]|nr:hypothetical protein [Thermoanaerobaculia bacterium]